METEAGLRQAEASLRAAQAAAAALPREELDLLAEAANREAQHVELDEATTRMLIDEQLQDAGWLANSADLQYAA